jgi:hypothetical protein
MTTIQFGREDFGAFTQASLREGRKAVRANILPQLERLSVDLLPALAALAGYDLDADVGVRGNRERPLQEAFIAFGAPTHVQDRAHFTFGVSRAGVHARVTLPAGASRDRARLADVIERDLFGLCKRFRSLAGLRSYAGAAEGSVWANGSLPAEVTLDEGFWNSLVEPLRNASGEIDLGFGWPASRARTLALIEILTAFERLAPFLRLAGTT